ncbi:hypothetical protein Y032_0485g2322 [Ancylostoma ceylanicum]|uniref:Uncharacterized protein n=1 Tax=Ancylostoma ceylanicum TaxID=53326 RepID=A0A016WWL5_9BILA|nr:hypothetical protein Y032_0485g2322 [Ancylostoma ceylanicum]
MGGAEGRAVVTRGPLSEKMLGRKGKEANFGLKDLWMNDLTAAEDIATEKVSIDRFTRTVQKLALLILHSSGEAIY